MKTQKTAVSAPSSPLSAPSSPLSAPSSPLSPVDAEDLAQSLDSLLEVIPKNCMGELCQRSTRSEQLIARYRAQLAEKAQECTGFAASWCPRCGDCTCDRFPSGERINECAPGNTCPLHGFTSTHAEPQQNSASVPAQSNTIDDLASALRRILDSGFAAPEVERARNLLDRYDAQGVLGGFKCIHDRKTGWDYAMAGNARVNDIYDSLVQEFRRTHRESGTAQQPEPSKPALSDRVRIWEAINRYVVACGGDPSNGVYGNTSRQLAVAGVERAICDFKSHLESNSCIMSRESFNETISNASEELTHLDEEEPTQLPIHLRESTNGYCATCARIREIANVHQKAQIERLERTIQRLVTTIKSNVVDVLGSKVVPVIHLFDATRDAESVIANTKEKP